jgi:CheY-like chemotaxis protein
MGSVGAMPAGPWRRGIGGSDTMTPQPLKPRVLIVDDRPSNRLAFRNLLDAQYTIFVASDGPEALELVRKMDFAVILLDVRMPGMDGFEVAEQLRRSERTRYTPVVFMSAYDKTDLHAKKGYVAGATDYLFSPVDEDLLKFKVSTYVQLYLRNESLWMQVQQLQDTIHILREELLDCNPSTLVQGRMRRLESQVHTLKAELIPVPHY